MTLTARRWFSVFDDRWAADTMDRLLGRAGITLGGDAPWDIHVHDERVFARVLRDGTLGWVLWMIVPEDVQNIGEHYDRTLMAWWDNFAYPRT